MRGRLPVRGSLVFCALSGVALCIFFGAVHAVAADSSVQVIVEGLKGDVLVNVEAALTLPSGLIQEGKVNKQWLERFEAQAAAKVREALEPFGYFAAKIATSLETIDERTYILRVAVQPGEPVRVAEITVTVEGAGARERELTALAEVFPVKKDDILLQGKYEEAKGALRAKAVDLGYLDADFSVHEIRVFETELKAAITLKLDTGPQYLFDETRFEGAPRYRAVFLQRYLTYRADDVFSYSRLTETHLALLNSDRFRAVVVTPEKEKVHDLHVPVLIRLEPSEPKRLRVGAGYGTDTGGRLTVHYRDLNMFRAGHEFDAVLNLSQKLQGLGVDYVVPDNRDVKSYTEVKLNLKREEVTAYINKLVSLEVDRTRSIGKGQLLSIYVKAQRENFEVGGERANSRLVLPGIRISGRQFDNLARPRDAYRYEIDVHGTHQLLGSNTGLVQVVAQGDKITPLSWQLSLLTRIKAGLTFHNDPLERLPVSIRFFAGGDRSVRGYSYQSLGPKDAAGNVVGGKNVLIGSIELERPLSGDWGIAVFYDAGNSFNSFSSITLFQGAGMGLRYYTRIGTVRVDVARQVGIENPKLHLHFNVGAEF